MRSIGGTLVGWCYADGLVSHLNARASGSLTSRGFAELVRANAAKLATKAGIEIELTRKSSSCKEARIKQRLTAHRATSEVLRSTLSRHRIRDDCPCRHPIQSFTFLSVIDPSVY